MRIQPLRTYVERARSMVPAEDLDRPVRRKMTIARGMGVMFLFDLNDALITRFAGELPEIWDATEFEWVRALADDWEAIRDEFIEYGESHTSIPETASVSGLDPDSPEGKLAVPVKAGRWRALVIVANGDWVDATARYFPRAKQALAGCPQMTTVGFSVLDPHTHIDGHVGTNRGALRVQLPIIVPGAEGDCRIDIGDETVVWREGEPVMFDLGVWHEAWNDSDGTRVLFMIETAMPLRWPLSALNRVVQYLYRYFPSFRQMPARIGELERHTVKA